MSTIKYAVICAAGMGTRLGLNIPKCLVEIQGKKLIEYQLELLKNVENIRIVVGFMEELVIEEVKKIRNDVVFVRNPIYNQSSNAYSLYLGTKDLVDPYLMMDGDLFIDKASFEIFEKKCVDETLIGIMKSYTEEAVFVDIDENSQEILSFSRSPISNYEWAGMAYFVNISIDKDGNYVYTELEKHLPLKGNEVLAYEIDTPTDLEYVKNQLEQKL